MNDFAIYVGIFTVGTLFGMLICALFSINKVQHEPKYEPPQNYEE
jgi:hypothetical protein